MPLFCHFALARRGIDARGKIVIARYGKGWRGLKPKLAQEHGAIGCIIYSDPRDDGYAKGDIYPEGGWRPPVTGGFNAGYEQQQRPRGPRRDLPFGHPDSALPRDDIGNRLPPRENQNRPRRPGKPRGPR